MKKTNLALIGKGKWGQNYISTINSLPQCQLLEKNIKTRNYKDLFNEDDIDGVIIATPTSTHYKIAKELLAKGFNILIEKPITKTSKQAHTLLKISNAHPKTIIMAGHIQLYDPAYIKMKKNIKKIGVIKKLTYKGLQSPVRSDATVLEDWGPHPTYLFMDIVGQKPTSVTAKKTGVDNIRLELKFKNGITGVANIGWTHPERKREFSIIGTNGILTLENSSPTKQLFMIDKKGKKQNINFDTKYSPLALEILEFAKSISSGKQPKTSIQKGVEVIRILKSISPLYPSQLS